MPVNTVTFNQLATVLNSIVSQATGATTVAATNTSTFVSQAITALNVGYDPLATAISQVLGKTIFSRRDYAGSLRLLETDEQTYGNHTRKIQPIDKPMEEDDRIKLTDGQSIDPFVVNKPSVVQTNFYGINVYQKSMTIYRDQLDCAFSSPEEFGRFIAMVMGNAMDQLEQAREETRRFTLLNLIGGTVKNNVAAQNVKLVTEYNAAIGSPSTPLTLTDLLAIDKFPDFARWIFGRITAASRALKDRTVLYHQNPTTATPVGGKIARHTPVADQRLVLYAPFFDRVNTNVLSTSFNDEYLKLLPHEEVNFWQAAGSGQAINITAGYTNTAGAATSAAFSSSVVLGILFDREAAGTVRVNQWSAPSPFNPRGGYYNQYWHESSKYFTDSYENAIVFTLD